MSRNIIKNVGGYEIIYEENGINMFIISFCYSDIFF